MSTTATVLVLYYSRKGSTESLAREVARGVESAGAAALVRTVPPVATVVEVAAPPVPDTGPPYIEASELSVIDGLILGSPTRFGNMAAALKHFLDQTSSQWLNGTLAGKPAGVFTTSSSLHGGQESTLLTMALPLIHHGMIYVGVPYTDSRLFETRSGGSPYGATRVTADWSDGFDPVEKAIARVLGHRVATIAQRLRDQ